MPQKLKEMFEKSSASLLLPYSHLDNMKKGKEGLLPFASKTSGITAESAQEGKPGDPLMVCMSEKDEENGCPQHLLCPRNPPDTLSRKCSQTSKTRTRMGMGRAETKEADRAQLSRLATQR